MRNENGLTAVVPEQRSSKTTQEVCNTSECSFMDRELHTQWKSHGVQGKGPPLPPGIVGELILPLLKAPEHIDEPIIQHPHHFPKHKLAKRLAFVTGGRLPTHLATLVPADPNKQFC